jgi:hypothetical protein
VGVAESPTELVPASRDVDVALRHLSPTSVAVVHCRRRSWRGDTRAHDGEPGDADVSRRALSSSRVSGGGNKKNSRLGAGVESDTAIQRLRKAGQWQWA